MKGIVHFLTANYYRSALFTALFSLLASIIPLSTIVSGAIPALTTLQFGYQRSISIVIGAFLVMVAFLAATNALIAGTGIGYMPAILVLLTVWLPMLFIAEVLRRTNSLSLTMYAATALGIIAAFVTMALLPYYETYWREVWELSVAMMNTRGNVPPTDALEKLFALVPGVVIAAILLIWLLMVLLARWWQLLFTPAESFGEEFARVAVSFKYTLGVIALLAIGLVAWIPILIQVGLIALIPVFLLQGISVWYVVLGRRQERLWQILFYLILVMVLFVPWLLLALIFSGLLESFMQLRKRLLTT